MRPIVYVPKFYVIKDACNMGACNAPLRLIDDMEIMGWTNLCNRLLVRISWFFLFHFSDLSSIMQNHLAISD